MGEKKEKALLKPAPDGNDTLWTLEEAMAYLRIPRSTFYQELEKGTIKGKLKLGKQIRFIPELLKAGLKRQAS
jgi:excisionase family DNA binding protein